MTTEICKVVDEHQEKTISSLDDLDDAQYYLSSTFEDKKLGEHDREQSLNKQQLRNHIFIEEYLTQKYANACTHLQVIPCRRVMTSLTLTSIEVTYQALSYRDVKAMLNVLRSNTFVKSLVLRGNRVNDDLARDFYRFLRGNSCLELLDLSENELGNNSFALIGESIEENNTLLELNLSSR